MGQKLQKMDSDVTYTKEKRAFFSLLKKCWRSCFGKKKPVVAGVAGVPGVAV
jgi:hypothetical protein